MERWRVILHSDLNAFYASVETLLDPSLRGKAIAVCGRVEDRHGIVLAKSEPAKRAGVKTGMAAWEAKSRCPNIIFVEPQYDEYLKYSRLTREIYGRYTDLIEPFGMDECWLDVTMGGFYGTGMEIAEKIRREVKKELGLTVSVGVSFNKVFAKLGSDMKKPDAVTEIPPDKFREKVWPLAVSELIYAGRATTAKLQKYGVHTVGQLANTSTDYLRKWLGINGVKLWRYANGLDDSRVAHMDFVSPLKSVGRGITCVSDLLTETEVKKVMLELSQDVGHRLRCHGLAALGVQICVRRSDLSFLQFQRGLPVKTQLPHEIAGEGFRLFCQRYDWSQPVRAVTIRATELIPQNDAEQLSMFIDNERRARRIRLEDAVEAVREKYGKKALTYAFLLGDKKMPDDGRETVRMPGLMYQ